MSDFKDYVDAEIVRKTGLSKPGEYEPDLPDEPAQYRPLSKLPLYPGEYHVPCVLLLDTSRSMYETGAIVQLNAGLKQFKSQLNDDPKIRTENKRIDVAIVSFGPDVRIVQGFVPACDIITPELRGNGETPLGGALTLAMDLIEEQKSVYKNAGTPYHRPWIYVITDGKPTDDYSVAARRLRWEEDDDVKKVRAYCVGVDNYDHATMLKIFKPNRIFELGNHNFSAAFEFLSASVKTLANEGENSKAQTALPQDMRLVPIND